MDTTLWIIIYSKFSEACHELFSLIQKHKIPTPFKMLEIDNKEIRNRILSDKRFSIKTVPCIISLSANGVASQYEGPKAFELIYAMKPVEEVHRPVVELQDTKPRPSSVILRDEPQPQYQPQLQQQAQNNEVVSNQDNSVTLIEDLLDQEVDTRPAPLQKTDEGSSILNKGDGTISNSIKGEKVSVSSVLSQAQKSEFNPRNSVPQRPEMRDREEPPKQTGAKVNISSIMSSVRT